MSDNVVVVQFYGRSYTELHKQKIRSFQVGHRVLFRIARYSSAMQIRMRVAVWLLAL